VKPIKHLFMNINRKRGFALGFASLFVALNLAVALLAEAIDWNNGGSLGGSQFRPTGSAGPPSGGNGGGNSVSTSTSTSSGDNDYHTPGSPSEYPNVVYSSDGRRLHPAPGFTWVDPKGSSKKVRPANGRPFKNYAHVVWGPQGQPEPAPGYQWRRQGYLLFRGDYGVMILPDGTPCVESPIKYSHPDTLWNGHIVWAGTGGFRPMRGYAWFDQDAAMALTDIRVVRLEPTADSIELPSEVEDSVGVFEARKGAEAASKGDWNVASAWYGTALQKDPKNATLKRMADDARVRAKR
jgi:hypothetical protein